MRHIYDSLFLKYKDSVRRDPDAEALVYKDSAMGSVKFFV